MNWIEREKIRGLSLETIEIGQMKEEKEQEAARIRKYEEDILRRHQLALDNLKKSYTNIPPKEDKCLVITMLQPTTVINFKPRKNRASYNYKEQND
jgi:hypothetical protein